ncbi:hypothetical protein J6P68_03060 [bacterium]|nr:hypothetical protein [bacterium]
MKSHLAKYFVFNDINNLFSINRFLNNIIFFISLCMVINFVIISPYIILYTHSFFSFNIAFLIGLNAFIFNMKAINEDYIFLTGKPNKYYILGLIELIMGIIVLTLGSLLVFFINYFDNILCLLYMLLIAELITRTTKLICNIIFLNKFIYHFTFKKYLKNY